MATLVGDEKARGPSECIAVACERCRGGVQRCTVAALSPSRSASRPRSTPLTMGGRWQCSADSRALALEPNSGRTTACGAAMLGHALANSTHGDNSPQLEYHKAVSRDRNSSLYCVDGLLRRRDNIYSVSALMYAEGLTLVASGAGIHACAAAMQHALPLITTWAAELNLKTNVDKSDAALFYISSHTRSDEETVDLHIGSGSLRVYSRPVRLLGTTTDQLLNFGTHASTAAKQTVPRR
ncbi:hypothetical protein MOQ_010114 [Trypanosoma cruzi marinkellei]|uniref:Uncharacterized protein n=1 Tax=Trypanosoma cruzi marinkellei TaxID=85056 RepID=K2LU15_TRYCR|nr:hypothetical protein MOQ_010114 [Trypanosoma cruzi marinkellei]